MKDKNQDSIQRTLWRASIRAIKKDNLGWDIPYEIEYDGRVNKFRLRFNGLELNGIRHSDLKGFIKQLSRFLAIFKEE